MGRDGARQNQRRERGSKRARGTGGARERGHGGLVGAGASRLRKGSSGLLFVRAPAGPLPKRTESLFLAPLEQAPVVREPRTPGGNDFECAAPCDQSQKGALRALPV